MERSQSEKSKDQEPLRRPLKESEDAESRRWPAGQPPTSAGRHCPGPKMRNQDHGRRGQPLQNREPLPGAQDEESRRRPAWATSTRSRATARGPR